VAELGAGVDELEVNLLKSPLLNVCEERLPEGEDTLLGSNAATLQEDEVLLNLSVMWESTHGGDGLVGKVILSGGVILNQLPVLHGVSSSHSVYLLVDLSSVMVTLLSSSGNGELDPTRMPSSNTGNFPQALMGLPWQLLGMPSAGDTWENYWVKMHPIRFMFI